MLLVPFWTCFSFLCGSSLGFCVASLLGSESFFCLLGLSLGSLGSFSRVLLSGSAFLLSGRLLSGSVSESLVSAVFCFSFFSFLVCLVSWSSVFCPGLGGFPGSVRSVPSKKKKKKVEASSEVVEEDEAED